VREVRVRLNELPDASHSGDLISKAVSDCSCAQRPRPATTGRSVSSPKLPGTGHSFRSASLGSVVEEVWIHLCAITTGSAGILIGNASGTQTAIGVGHRDSDARYGPLVLIAAERKWLPCLNHSQRHALSIYARQFPASIRSRLDEKSHREDCLSKVPVVTLAFWEACRPFARGTEYGCVDSNCAIMQACGD
jgi:hypothetical protein